MRTNKELIQLALDNFDECFSSGLCGLFKNMAGVIIFGDEYIRLHNLIDLNRPDSTRGKLFWWPSGEREPRVEFLNNILKTLS